MYTLTNMYTHTHALMVFVQTGTMTAVKLSHQHLPSLTSFSFSSLSSRGLWSSSSAPRPEETIKAFTEMRGAPLKTPSPPSPSFIFTHMRSRAQRNSHLLSFLVWFCICSKVLTPIPHSPITRVHINYNVSKKKEGKITLSLCSFKVATNQYNMTWNNCFHLRPRPGRRLFFTVNSTLILMMSSDRFKEVCWTKLDDVK